VLFLAIAWDSHYFKRLTDRTADDGVKFWTLRRIRLFGLVLCSWNIASLCLTLLHASAAAATSRQPSTPPGNRSRQS
jgi:hypothetical protein